MRPLNLEDMPLDLHPSDLYEITRADMILEFAEDIRTGFYTKLIYNSCKVLKSWGNEFTNSKICFADYDLFDVLDVHEILCPGYLEAYTILQAYYDRISKRPKIRDMRESEVFKNRNLHGNGVL